MLAPKPPQASVCVMTEMVLPNDTNPLGNLMGGQLLHLMDICTAIAAQRHAGQIVVTAAVDFVEFEAPIRLGEVVVLEGLVNRAFTTSMEVQVDVWAENPRTGERRKCNRAFYTFVALDEQGTPSRVPPIAPTTEAERLRYDAAAQRRELRLIQSGRLKAREAQHLKGYIQALLGPDTPS